MCTGNPTRMSGKITTLLPFINEMFEQLAKHLLFCYLNGYSGYHQLLFIRMIKVRPPSPAPSAHLPLGGCHLVWQCTYFFPRSMMVIFSDPIENIMEAFMDGFSVYNESLKIALENLTMILKRFEETHLEKCHFMVREGVVLGTRFSLII